MIDSTVEPVTFNIIIVYCYWHSFVVSFVLLCTKI